MKESDWKKFKKLKEIALDRFCAKALSEFSDAIEDKENTNHGKYLYLYKLVENTDKHLSLLFDGHSRSKAPIQFMLIREEGLIENVELEGLSDEFLKSTTPLNR